MTMIKIKRTRYFIDRDLQLKYMLLTVLLLVAYSFLFVAIIIAPSIFPLAFDYPAVERAEAARTLLVLHNTIWPALAVVIAVMSVVSIVVTHKIAGPVYRFKQVLREVQRGNLDISIRLREKDDLKDVAADLNAVIGDLNALVRAVRYGDDNLSACAARIDEMMAAKRLSPEAGRPLQADIRAAREELSPSLVKYSGSSAPPPGQPKHEASPPIAEPCVAD